MQTNLLRMIAVTCSCLCAAPSPALARPDSEIKAAHPHNRPTISGNAATGSLQRAVARATTAVFSPLESVRLGEPTYLEDMAFSTDQAQGGTQDQKKKPSATNPTAPSLPDLFPSEQTQGNARQQALLDKRTHMLKVHQRLGLITAIPMVAALITGPQAKAKGKNGETITEPTSANLDLHIALGGLTTGLYCATAYYAIFAPKVAGVKPRGAIRLHRDLAWVHGSGMILTAVLGIMAYNQENAGEKVHGIASAHGVVAYTTAAAYGASIVAVSWPIHWKFWR